MGQEGVGVEGGGWFGGGGGKMSATLAWGLLERR